MQTTPTSSAPSPTLLASDAAGVGQHSATAPQARDDAVQSEALLQGRKAVAISHNGAIYRLQATKLGKLILTK